MEVAAGIGHPRLKWLRPVGGDRLRRCVHSGPPMARMESVRVLVLAAQEGWRVHHMDVKSAFLNGDLKELTCFCLTEFFFDVMVDKVSLVLA